ncbi:hypothetical protein ACSBR1_015538 [Camellia fascicularis]
MTDEAHHKQLSEELESVLRREEMYLHQRSRVRWLNFGDRNSAFFHATITQRRQRNQLLQLKAEDVCLLSSESDINSHLNCFSFFGTSRWGKSVICSIIWVAWTIWKGRNDHLFNHCLVDPAGVIRKPKNDEAEFLATCTVTTAPVLAGTGRWKFNCDAAFDLRQGTGAVAVLLRDHLGILVDGMACKIRVRSVAQGELLAVRHACLMADASNLAVVDVESDCKSVIYLCVSEGVPPWELLAMISDVRYLATNRQLNFVWCPRKGNRAAHWVASACLYNSLPNDWVTQPPMGLVRCLSSISM